MAHHDNPSPRIPDLAEKLCDAAMLLDGGGRILEIRSGHPRLRALGACLGKPLADLLAGDVRESAAAALEKARRDGEAAFEGALALPAGSMRWAAVRLARFGEPGGGELLAAVCDRTPEWEKDNEIRTLRRRDRMTGFYNRTHLDELLSGFDGEKSLPLLVVTLDINGMKLTNDAFGYAQGDQLILRAATVLKTVCPARGAITRLGGDEFLMLIPRCGADEGKYIADAIARLCEEEDDAMVPPNLSMGIALKTRERQDIYSVIREADEMLNRNRGQESRRHSNRLIRRLMDHLESMNFETGKHIVRVKGLSLMLGDALGLGDAELDSLSLAADLHDVGKVAIPEEILGKRGPLTPDEWEIVRKHPETGYRVAYALPEFIGIAPIVLHHHEWWNGEGYPYGLAGEDIPLLSRIISVADAYDNMINAPYRKSGMTRAAALSEIARCGGTQFDPAVASRFTEIMSREE